MTQLRVWRLEASGEPQVITIRPPVALLMVKLNKKPLLVL